VMSMLLNSAFFSAQPVKSRKKAQNKAIAGM
jgi:hypothetical protein